MIVEFNQIGDAAFHIAGATIWADGNSYKGFHLGPFEFEFHFGARGDPLPKRTVVKFGALDHDGRIVRVPHDSPAHNIVRRRPTANKDWAMAIELSGYDSQR